MAVRHAETLFGVPRILPAVVLSRRACSVTDLYAPQEIRDLVHAADAEYVSAVMSNKPDCYSKGLDALEKIRPQLVELARKELQSL